MLRLIKRRKLKMNLKHVHYNKRKTNNCLLPELFDTIAKSVEHICDGHRFNTPEYCIFSGFIDSTDITNNNAFVLFKMEMFFRFHIDHIQLNQKELDINGPTTIALYYQTSPDFVNTLIVDFMDGGYKDCPVSVATI